jgi:lipopolysaccharide export system protein LptC
LMEDQSTVTLDALNGLMDNKQQTLDLHKDIYLQTTTGYEAWLSQAFVDMGKGTVTSDEHVDVKWADGRLSADKLKITGGGEVVRFDGHVVMNIDKLPPPETELAAPEPAPPPVAAHPAKTRSVSSKSANPK